MVSGVYQPIICPQCRLDSTIRHGEHGLIVVHCRICGTTFAFDLVEGVRLTE